MPLVAPRIRTSSLSVGTITVDWSPLLAREKRGVITQYKIYFQKVDGGREQTNVIHNDTTTYTIHGKPDFWFLGGEGVKKGECIGKDKKKWDESFWEQVLLSVELLNSCGPILEHCQLLTFCNNDIILWTYFKLYVWLILFLNFIIHWRCYFISKGSLKTHVN